MTKRKDYSKEITADNYNDLSTQLFKITGDGLTLYGTINDNYIFYTENLPYRLNKRIKMRKFLKLYTKYQTCWTCTYHLLMTDNDQVYNDFLTEYEKQEQEEA